MKNNANILIYNITIYNMQKYKVGKHNHNDFINTRKSNQFYFMNFGIMEYLVNLLNEYEIQSNLILKIWKYEGTLYYSNYKDENVFDNVYFEVISKNYWFINWLVKCDKVNLDKLKEDTQFTMIMHVAWFGYTWDTAKEWEDILKEIWANALVMKLSIQNKPIEYLLSILK